MHNRPYPSFFGDGSSGGADGTACSENGNHLHGWQSEEKNHFMFAIGTYGGATEKCSYFIKPQQMKRQTNE